MLYDFGKVKSGVDVEEAKVQVEQANVLVSVDTLALDVAQTIVNIQRYLQLNKIAEQQIAGIRRIQEIANLRANAGVASQADPIQAQSYLQAAQSRFDCSAIIITSIPIAFKNLIRCRC